MIRQTFVELSRLRARRAAWWIAAAMLLLAVLWSGERVISTGVPTAADLAQAESNYQAQVNSPDTQRAMEDCEADPQGWGATADADCAELVIPPREAFLNKYPLQLREETISTVTTRVPLYLMLLVFLGTTFAGADWASGSMSNQLLFNSRRWQVWWAKGVAVAKAAGLLTALGLGVLWAILLLTARSRNQEISGEVVSLVGSTTLRAVIVAAIVALLAYALTMLFRSTVASLGIIFAVVIVGGIFLSFIPIEGIGRWQVGNNLFAVLQDGYRYYDFTLCRGDLDGTCDPTVRLSSTQGAIYLAGLIALVCGVSTWSFGRRDVP